MIISNSITALTQSRLTLAAMPYQLRILPFSNAQLLPQEHKPL